MPIGDYDNTKTADSSSFTGTPTLNNVLIPFRLEAGEDSTGNGVCVLDSGATIDGQEDIAFYDENDTLLPYYWVRFDTSNDVYIAYVAMPSLALDGTTQVKIGYGDGVSDESDTIANVSDGMQNATMRYPFEESTVSDATSNGNDPVAVNGTTPQVSGYLNNARDFDGNDDNVEPPGVLSNEPQDVSWSFWVNMDAFEDARIYDLRGDQYTRMSVNADGTFEAVTYDGYDGKVRTAKSTTTLNTGEWHHIACVYDNSSASVEIFVDGVSEDFNGGNPTAQVTGQQSNIMANGGGSGGFNTSPQDGQVAEVRIQDAVLAEDRFDAIYRQSPQAGWTLFSWNASQAAATFEGVTTTANASGTGGTASLSGTTTTSTTTANASGTGDTIFIEPDFATLTANGTGTGNTINLTGSSTLTTSSANATGTGETLSVTFNLGSTTTAQANASGTTIATDRLTGNVDVDGSNIAGVDVNVVDKTNNVLYETTTNSDGDWAVDSSSGVVYHVAYLYDDGTTYYGDAEETDTT